MSPQLFVLYGYYICNAYPILHDRAFKIKIPHTENDVGYLGEACLLHVYLFNEVRDFFFCLLFGVAVALLHQPG